ncbi:S8 family serine peptidase [bacterium]|nr:S8 family serine peptidase [bacterium]
MRKVIAVVLTLTFLFVGAPVHAQEGAQSYLIIANGQIPNNLTAQIARAGGEVTNVVSEAGLVVASSANPNFRSDLKGPFTVVPNILVQMTQPVERVAVEDVANPPFSGDDDRFFDLQWGLDAVNAPEAWAAGSRGAGATVAVLDGGFQLDHPDLAPNIVAWYDATGEGIEYGPNTDDATGIFSHGMHVAGTIGSPDNGIGGIGVAPEVDLVLVKVLFNYGSGSFEDVVEGIIWAANYPGMDVINMSLGADIPQGAGIGSNEVAALRSLMNRAISYAHQQGVTVIAAAGNDGRDLDKDKSLTVFPAQMPHAISISSTAPVGWAVDPANADLDNLASYSNYGRSGIDLAAPGGDFVYPGNEACLIAGLVRPCWVFDLVFSTGALNSWYWSAGTSMAAPHAAGVAALIVAENGGSMHPAQVKAEMQRRAADLGQPGNDPIYGAGRVSSGY